MTNLERLPRKGFVLTMPDGTKHEGRCGTWALARFGQKRKIGLTETSDLLNKMQMMDLLDFFVCAVEGVSRSKGEPITFNEYKMGEWMDENPEGLGELLMVLNDEEIKEEKKSGNQEQSQPGETLSGQPILQE